MKRSEFVFLPTPIIAHSPSKLPVVFAPKLPSKVETFMRECGHAQNAFDDYRSELLAIEDLHEGNVLIDEDGCQSGRG